MINRVFMLPLIALACMVSLSSCINNGGTDEKMVRAIVPVTVTSPRVGKMAEYTELMATSSFLVKAVIKSSVTGYVEKCSVSPGDKVAENQIIFQLRTRESVALKQDSLGSLNLPGKVVIRASLGGVVAAIDHPQGDFVQEGDALSTIVVPGSLVFLLEVPFELKSLIHPGQACRLILPDKKEITAFVKSVLPSMSGASQTQRVVLRPRTQTELPENLMATVKMVRNEKTNAIILPKSCILNDEVMKNFWVMKLVSDSLAVKVPIITGIRGIDSVEVIAPLFKPSDRILSGGNYGLGDSVSVRIIKQE